jgi:uncharacterized protein YyaL (SSP411 family)
MPNRLADSTSPYLLQHKDNPVDWYEWGPEAFAAARERDVPVLLSVGYAACHWCHVMAHESFEDADTAAYMNAHFVNVKVDREERPDVDAVYMEATQALTGHGGWPMTCFLTPTGEPFHCGTYFPPRPVRGMPSFRQLLEAVERTWRERREEVLSAGEDIVARLSEMSTVQALGSHGSSGITQAQLDAGVTVLAGAYDPARGGFGGAPKFPPSLVLEFLLRHVARTRDPRAAQMAEGTYEAMARGGMYDQLGGGFARYSVDADWVVPHFEKMLYDNALLLRGYAHWWRQTGSPLAERVTRETAEFLLRDLRTAEGGFASALDADTAVVGPDGSTHGVEGLTYVWTPDELRAVLGDADGAWAASLLSVTEAGTFEHGASVLQLRRDPDDAARWTSVRARLWEVRRGRPQPSRDDKVVAAWNGLTMAALAEAGALLAEPRWVSAARDAAALLERLHLVDGRLRRTSRDGAVGSGAGVLEDHGDVAEGLLALASVTGEGHWVGLAGGLLEVVLTHFGDASGGFYDTADDAEQLVRRPQDPTDGATPSGASAAAGALLTYSALTGSTRHREAAEGVLGLVAPLVERQPRFAGWSAAVAEASLAGPVEVAVVGAASDPAAAALRRVAHLGAAPGAVVAWADPADVPGEVPLLADRPLVDGGPAAYVCRGFVCERPTTDPAALAAALGVNTDVHPV